MAIEHTVVEAIHKWQLDRRVHGDEEAVRLTALTNALKGSDRLKVVRAFFYLLAVRNEVSLDLDSTNRSADERSQPSGCEKEL